MDNAQYKKRNAQLLLGHHQMCLVFEQLIAHLAVNRSRHPIEAMIAHLDQLEAEERATKPSPIESSRGAPVHRCAVHPCRMAESTKDANNNNCNDDFDVVDCANADTSNGVRDNGMYSDDNTDRQGGEAGAECHSVLPGQVCGHDAASRSQVAPLLPHHAPRRLVVLFGPPRSGKTTQCIMTAAAWNSVVLAPNRLLENAIHGSYTVSVPMPHTVNPCVRDEDGDKCVAPPFRRVSVAVPPELQCALARAQRDEQTVSTDVLTQLIANQVRCVESAGQGPFFFILDNYPRTVEQALGMEHVLGPVYVAMELYCPRELSMQRQHSSRTADAELLRGAEEVNHTSTHSDGNDGTDRYHDNCDDASSAAACRGNCDAEDGRLTEERWYYEHDEAIALREYWKGRRVLQVVDGTVDCATCGHAVHRVLRT